MAMLPTMPLSPQLSARGDDVVRGGMLLGADKPRIARHWRCVAGFGDGDDVFLTKRPAHETLEQRAASSLRVHAASGPSECAHAAQRSWLGSAAVPAPERSSFESVCM